MNYHRWYMGDHLANSLELSMLEEGALRRMLDHYYAQERPLPLELRRVFGLARAASLEEQAAVRCVLAAKFTAQDDGYHNARADKEIAVAQQARTNGGRGGRPTRRAVAADGDETGSETRGETEAGTTSKAERATGEGGGLGHPPSTNHQPPTTTHQNRGGARGTRLPEDWVLPNTWGEWALKEQPTWDADHMRKQALNFRDYWTTKPENATKLNWERTWQSWVRKSDPRPAPGRLVIQVPPVPFAARRCAFCGSAPVIGSVGQVWHCASEACRYRAMYGGEAAAA